MINNEYLARLPKNKLLAANKICTDYFEDRLKERPSDIAYTLEVLLEDELPHVEFFSDSAGIVGTLLQLTRGTVSLASISTERRIYSIHRHVKALLAKATITNPSLINTFLIELSGDETKRIDELLADIRNIIRESDVISDEHKRRLLRVVNDLQAEVDKEYSDFRVFLDGMVEVSEAVGEAGEKVKPVFDRIKELFGIADKVRKTKEAIEAPQIVEALPPPPKELPPPSSSESTDD